MSLKPQAACSANSLELAKQLVEQHIDDVYEILGGDTYTTLDDIITILGSTVNQLAEKSGEETSLSLQV